MRVAGTLFGRRNRPHLIEAWGQRFDVQLESHITLFRYQDLPGMLGRVGTVFGRHGVNIVSAAVGRQPESDPSGDGQLAAMVITTTAPVPSEVVDGDRLQRGLRRRAHRGPVGAGGLGGLPAVAQQRHGIASDRTPAPIRRGCCRTGPSVADGSAPSSSRAAIASNRPAWAARCNGVSERP